MRYCDLSRLAMAENIRLVSQERPAMGEAGLARVLAAGPSWHASFERLLDAYGRALNAGGEGDGGRP